MKQFLALFLVVLMAATSFGQSQENTVKKQGGGPRRQLATILFCGLGGAILGLSTLSFYGRPQDYLGNIGIGFAVGVISGTIYVTYKSATSHEYESSQDGSPLQWAPLVADAPLPNHSHATALGGQMAFHF